MRTWIDTRTDKKDIIMKKILFLTAFPPSENAAAEKNTMLMLRDLSEHGYQIDLVYFKDADKKEYVPESPSISVLKVIPNSKQFRIKNALKHLFIHPIFSVRFNDAVLSELQNSINYNNYSAIVFDHSQTLTYARKLQFDGPKLLVCHDVEAQRFERTSNKLMAWLCKFSERQVLSSKNANVFAFCQKDIDLIKEYYSIDGDVILDYIDDRIKNNIPEKISEDFVMFGNWHRKDNYEGALWLLNGLSDYLSDMINVNIIGKGFPIEKINIDKNKIKLNFMGFVDDPYPVIARSKAMLSPLLSGAGIKVKVMEALASGTPVIGTDIAFEGFSEKFSFFMLKAQNLEDFSKQIEQLDCSLEERLKFKEMFIQNYQSMTIPKWLDENM